MVECASERTHGNGDHFGNEKSKPNAGGPTTTTRLIQKNGWILIELNS